MGDSCYNEVLDCIKDVNFLTSCGLLPSKGGTFVVEFVQKLSMSLLILIMTDLKYPRGTASAMCLFCAVFEFQLGNKL